MGNVALILAEVSTYTVIEAIIVIIIFCVGIPFISLYLNYRHMSKKNEEEIKKITK